MMEPVPTIPRWAQEAGMRSPLPGETFREFWSDMGAPRDVVEKALVFDDLRALPVANMRMASWLGRQIPRAREIFVERTLSGFYEGRNEVAA